MLRLFSTWYPCDEPGRQNEMTAALRYNLNCPAVDAVCLLREGEAPLPLESPKLTVREVGQRPSFKEFFAWIAEVQEESDIAVIANSDIWLDDSIALAKSYLQPQECWALARWDQRGAKPELFDRNDSQDAWVFHGPLKPIEGDFHLGGIRCDNRLLHELKSAGYIVKNPAFSVIIHHEHNEAPREYSTDNQPGYVDGPYAYQWPHNLLSLSETRRHNAKSGATIRWRVDPRQVKRSLPMRAWAFMRRGFKRSAKL